MLQKFSQNRDELREQEQVNMRTSFEKEKLEEQTASLQEAIEALLVQENRDREQLKATNKELQLAMNRIQHIRYWLTICCLLIVDC